MDEAALPGRLALSPTEAAAALGVSLTFFQEHIQPELPILRLGRRRLVRISALIEWFDANESIAAQEVAR
jgi:excisionase family DNA binding protein